MGSRANIVVIKNSNSQIFYHHWIAQYIDALIILGEPNLRAFLQQECDIDEDENSLMDNVWAEGGLLLDYDHKQLMWFGGEDSEGYKSYLDALTILLTLAWPGWDIKWADKGNYDFGVNLKFEENELQQITGDRLEQASKNLHSVAWSPLIDQAGIITIKGAKECVSRATGCCFVDDLLSFGIELASLYESMDASEVVIDERPDEDLQRWVQWAVDPWHAKQEESSSNYDAPWATLACGFSSNKFPEYGIYMDLENKYLEYWTLCGYCSSPVNRSLFPTEWTIEYKGGDWFSHLSKAGESIKLYPCDPIWYFPVIEGWTIYVSERTCSGINALELSSQEMQEYFESLYDVYKVEHPHFAFDFLIKGYPAKDSSTVLEPLSNAELGLPDPKDYDGEHFTGIDYCGPKYSEAHTLEEAIEMRGYDAFIERLDISDFDTGDPSMKFLGYAELWADSTWRKDDPLSRAVEVERAAYGVHEGDILAIMREESDDCDEEIAIYDKKGTKLPYRPYHDYDEINLSKWIDILFRFDRLVCKVDSVTCFGGDGVSPDPDFCWRVYTCTVTVYRVTQP